MSDHNSENSQRHNPLLSLPRSWPGLLLLWRQYRTAQAAREDPWEFTVAGALLRNAGLSPEDLRWLIGARYIDYATLTDPPPANGLTGGATNGSAAAVYILTDRGAAMMSQIAELLENDGAASLRRDAPKTGEPPAKPHWDPIRRELRYRGVVVKRFRKPAPNQELILAAFEESGWPQHIDDPLPPVDEIVPSVRLHDTLGRLNRTLKQGILHFGSDGTGQGICWRQLQ
jgi:hypothetical protein